MGKPEQPAKDAAEHCHEGLWGLNIFTKEWPQVKAAWASFAVCMLVTAVFVFGGAYWLVDRFHVAEIRGKDATIVTLSAERDAYKRQLEEAGISSFSLKKRAIILADQIADFARRWPTNGSPVDPFWEFEGRFEARILKIRDELDEHGQQSQEFDQESRLPNRSPGNFKPDVAIRLASHIRRLANNLRD